MFHRNKQLNVLNLKEEMIQKNKFQHKLNLWK